MQKTATLAALAVLLFAPLTHSIAATIHVESSSVDSNPSRCTLTDAIVAANTDSATGGCPAGSGADTIHLSNRHYVVVRAYEQDRFGDVGLPIIRSDISLASDSAEISAAETGHFTLLAVAPGGKLSASDLHINRAGLSGIRADAAELILDGVEIRDNGAAGIQLTNQSLISTGASLHLSRSTVSGNQGIANQLIGGVDISGGSYAEISTSTIANNAGGLGCAFLCGSSQNTQNQIIIRDSLIEANSSGYVGGISAVNSSLFIQRSTIKNNSNAKGTGGIFTDNELALIEQSNIIGNTSGSGTGGIQAGGSTRIISSTIANNKSEAMLGTGGLQLNGNSWLFNSTVSNNHGSQAGGIHAAPNSLIVASTIAENMLEPTIEQLQNQSRAAGILGEAALVNTLMAANMGGVDCAGSPNTNSKYFLSADGSCNAPYSGDPRLGPLTDNGNQTLTHALLQGSAAIDKIDPAYCDDIRLETIIELSGTDQRDVKRPQDGDWDGVAYCDIGAFEFAGKSGPAATPLSQQPVSNNDNAVQTAASTTTDTLTSTFDDAFTPPQIDTTSEQNQQAAANSNAESVAVLSETSNAASGGGTAGFIWLLTLIGLGICRKNRRATK